MSLGMIKPAIEEISNDNNSKVLIRLVFILFSLFLTLGFYAS